MTESGPEPGRDHCENHGSQAHWADKAQRAYELGCTTTEAARYHVPLCRSAPDAITKSRTDAHSRYLCANNGGPYEDPAKRSTVVSGGRSRSVDID